MSTCSLQKNKMIVSKQFTDPGDVAQLGERGVRNAEARGSIPLISTIS